MNSIHGSNYGQNNRQNDFNYFQRNSVVEQQLSEIDMQWVKQKQDQALSNVNMAVLFSTIESIYNYYTGGKWENNLFQYYDYCNFRKTKNIREQLEQLETQLIWFEGSFKHFYNRYGTYTLPLNFPIEIVKEYLHKWGKVSQLKKCCSALDINLFAKPFQSQSFQNYGQQYKQSTYKKPNSLYNSQQLGAAPTYKKRDLFYGANFSWDVLYNNMPCIANNTHTIMDDIKKDIWNGGTGDTLLKLKISNEENWTKIAMDIARQRNGQTEGEILKTIGQSSIY